MLVSLVHDPTGASGKDGTDGGGAHEFANRYGVPPHFLDDVEDDLRGELDAEYALLSLLPILPFLLWLSWGVEWHEALERVVRHREVVGGSPVCQCEEK